VTARGIALFAGTDADVVASTARATEELGYASFWLNHPGQTDGIGGLAPAAAATSTVDLGVGVVPLHLRGAESIVAGVREHALPPDRLLLGIGTQGPGAFRRARAGVAAIRSSLGCRVVMGALSEGACRLAGEIADGVVFNWLTPAHAARSATWVEEGAARAGRPRPALYAYIRVALGPDARARLETEGARYARNASYGAQFDAMASEPADTAVAAASPDEVGEALAAWDGIVDQVVLRLLPATESLESHLALVRAGAP
jgi:alkanesulfonate monooxygenase SsuD/methylene tetrahydromethanopterin reductase-like flavin-dependent oxidoreductase (luciferase family)